MPSGYKSGGTDFDDLFDPYVEGAKPGLTGYVAAGQDLRDRYAPISYGSKRADVGDKSGGQDVSNLWAAKGTAVYQSVVAVPGHYVFLPMNSTGVQYTDYPCVWGQDGQVQSQDTLTNWTSNGQPPLKNYQIRISEVSWESQDPDWLFVSTASAWTDLNSGTSAQIGYFQFRSDAVTAQRQARGQCRLEIRDVATGSIVLDQIFILDAIAGNL